ncbi:MAG: MaoC family dehydratase, partial [Pseudomonadota bacterium]
MSKTNAGRFFEDYRMGETLVHAVPRTLSGGERALYHALYPARHAVTSSDSFARSLGLPQAPLDPLIVFHTVFGKTVPDVSLNAVANLGYAQGRFLRPVYPGETLRAMSEVIGLKENSSGKSGIVWVRTRGLSGGAVVLDYVRWVMVHKRDPDTKTDEATVPQLAGSVPAEALVVPEDLSFEAYDTTLAGEPHLWADYSIGETIDHVDGVTLEDAEHMMATRLWQNTAKVHFDAT